MTSTRLKSNSRSFLEKTRFISIVCNLQEWIRREIVDDDPWDEERSFIVYNPPGE